MHLCLIGGLLTGCSDKPASIESDSSAMLRQLMEQCSRNDDQWPAPDAPVMPDDLALHPQARLESFAIQAIVSGSHSETSKTPDSTRHVVGLLSQMDRLSIRPSRTGDSEQSAWRYESIIRTEVSVDADRAIDEATTDEATTDEIGAATLARLTRLSPRQSVQRVSLDLAGHDDRQMWIGADQLLIEHAPEASGSCARHYQWRMAVSATDMVEINFALRQCPTVVSVGELNSWRQAGVEFTGTLISRVKSNGDDYGDETGDDTGEQESAERLLLPLQGYLWFRHSWGNLPSSDNAAVAIDTLQWVLDDGRVLDVSRSKRRSGRGPKTVTASVQAPGAEPVAIDMRWVDSVEQSTAATGALYPQSIQLIAEDDSLNVTVRVLDRLLETTDAAGQRLQSPVRVTGSHPGAGFIRFFTLPR